MSKIAITWLCGHVTEKCTDGYSDAAITAMPAAGRSIKCGACQKRAFAGLTATSTASDVRAVYGEPTDQPDPRAHEEE